MADDFDDLLNLDDEDEKIDAVTESHLVTPPDIDDDDLLGDLDDDSLAADLAGDPEEEDEPVDLSDMEAEEVAAEPEPAPAPVAEAPAPKRRGRPPKAATPPPAPDNSIVEALAAAIEEEPVGAVVGPDGVEHVGVIPVTPTPKAAHIDPVRTVEVPAGETDIQRRIREAKEELAKPVFVPGNELSEEERELRELENQLAIRAEKAFTEAPTQYVAPSGQGETVLIHFVRDGLTVNGEMTYRGQEMEFEIGGVAYEQTKDKFGFTPFSKEAVEDIEGQYNRWKDQYVALGPWRGKRWDEVQAPSGLKPDEKAEWEAGIAKAAEAERRRNRAAPVQQMRI